ncbi:sensor histidine kinase [Nonomuraea sp. NPDC050556]|uniref:sensor histidine kinase n=1 Tax=Nonomuraea sp. NPDC050556 TaxID=3364369 RepID=UPI00378AA585
MFAPLRRCLLLSLLALAVPLVGGLVVLAVLLLPVGLGFLLLPPAAVMLRLLSDRARAWTPAAVTGPEPLKGDRAPAILGDEGFWRDLMWAWLEPVTGGLLVTLPLLLVEYGAIGVVIELVAPQADWYGFLPGHNPVAGAVLGLGLAVAGVALAPAVLRLHARWSRWALAAPRSVELVRRIEHLTEARAEALDAQSAEVRRIERDLHDGAQARLISLGMALDGAARLLDSDPATARDLLTDARQNAAQALDDLRDLVHGIHPPVLADRGLGDAVRSLALDNFLDVHVETTLPVRLPPPVEAAAYFAVSEVLANAAKHAAAREVRIVMAARDAELRITVTDDGRGGADLAKGTGLRGVARRLDSFDGVLALHSPPGGPTTVTMEIPCALSSQKTSSC